MVRKVRVLLTSGVGSAGIITALAVGPITTAELPGPGAPLLPPNCLSGVHGQVVYCDQDLNPDGSWVRCWQPNPQQITIGGATTGDDVSEPQECRRVRLNTLPANSPPFHIGYGGEGPG